MYNYDFTKEASELKVLESAPVKLQYQHASGPVVISYTDGRWVAVTSRHKIHPLTLSVSPSFIMKPQIQKMLIAQIEAAVG